MKGGREPWYLLTSDLIRTADDAWEVVVPETNEGNREDYEKDHTELAKHPQNAPLIVRFRGTRVRFCSLQLGRADNHTTLGWWMQTRNDNAG